MAVVLYWGGRLSDRNPLRSEGLRVEGYNIKSHLERPEDGWPRAIAKQAMYQDYLGWFDNEYLPPFAEVGFYKDQPDQLPKPANELEFFTTIAPFVYVVGRKQQVRSYNVPEQQQYEGRWLAIKKYRNFVRLCTWEEHCAAYTALTGIPITNSAPPMPRRKDVETVAGAAKVVIRKIAQNKERIDTQMRKT